MDRVKKRRVALTLLIFVAAIALFNHIMTFPMRFRTGNLEEWLGPGPAGAPVYRAYRLVDETPVDKRVEFEDKAIEVLSSAMVLTANSPYGPNATTGRHENWLSARPVLAAPAPSSVSYRITIPEQASLSFGIAAKDILGKKLLNGARFIVEWRGPSGAARLFEEEVAPEPEGYWEMTKERQRFWYLYVKPEFKRRGDIFRDRVADLSKYAGEEGELIFRTEPIVKDKSLEFSPALWACPEVWAKRPADKEQPVNVVLFMIEATPATVIEPYTDKPAVHPNIRKFAEGAVVFDKFFTAGDSTNLSVFSFFTGRHYTSMGLPQEMYYLAPMVKARFYKRRFPTLAEAFSRAGYKTASFGSNHYFMPSRDFGLDLGFDQVEVQGRRFNEHGDTMLAAMEWLRNNGDKPFFLYIHYDAPHDESKPFIEDLLKAFTFRSPDRRWTYRKQMAQQIAVDRDFGNLLDALDTLGVRDRTLVIVTADHGNCLDPAHEFAVLRADREKPWRTAFQHGRAMGIEDIHIPFIIDWPIGKGKNRRIKMQASSIDLFPTLVELLIPDPPPDLKERMEDINGKSMAGVIKGDEDEPYPCKCPVYAISRGGDHLVTYGRYHYFKRSSGFQKILYPNQEKLRIVREGLFDIAEDPRELDDISASQPEVLDRIKERLESVLPEEDVLRFIHMNFEKVQIRGKLEFNDEEGPGLVMTFPEEREPIILERSAGPVRYFSKYYFETDLDGPAGIIIDKEISSLEFEVNGEKLCLKDLRLGSYGLPFSDYRDKCSISDQWLDIESPCPSYLDSLLFAQRRPLRYVNEPGVYFYKMTFNDFVAETFSDQELSPAVKAVLKQWGYIE
jgi:arylsulfatase A-like enzyme